MGDQPDDTTVTSADEDVSAVVARLVAHPSPAFTLVWSAHEPWRVGESLVLSGPRPWVLGRDGKDPSAQLFAQRAPGRSPESAPLSGEAISRRQLEIDFADGGGLAIKNVGKAPVRVNGERIEPGAVHPIAKGDVIAIAGAYAFLVGERAATPHSHFSYPATHAFGEADVNGIVGESAAIWRLRGDLAAAADARTHVLVLGETGVGKELAARAVHRLSDRANKPYLPRNAATLTEGVFDVEMFGNARGYPNGVGPEREGLIGAAEGGVLMLDEIGTIPNALQAKLLTLLDRGSYLRLGDTRERRGNVIVVAATNSRVEDLKNDLGPRFKIKVQLPPLSERREDIPLIARHLVLEIAKTSEIARRYVTEVRGRPEVRMSCELMTALVRRAYKANTRELEAVLRDAMIASDGGVIDLLPDAGTTSAPLDEASDDAITEAQLRHALEKCAGNQTRAGEMLGISRHRIRRLMERFGL